MLHLFLLLVLATTLSHAAETQKPNVPLTLRFPDYGDETFKTSTHQIAWSKTIKDSVDDLVTQDPIPLHNVEKSIFTCLSRIHVLSENPVMLLDTSVSLNKVQAKVIDTLFTQGFSGINYRDLLIQANYLDVHHKVKNSLAKPYADNLRNPKIAVLPGNDIVFDNLPHELEPLPAGWLWHDMLQKLKTQTHSYDLRFGQLHIEENTIISNSSSSGNVVCMWRQLPDDSSYDLDGTVRKLALVDFNNQKNTMRFTTNLHGLSRHSRCALSHNGRYFLISTNIEEQFGGDVCHLHLYDLHDIKQNKPQHTTIEIKRTLTNSENIAAIIYDDTKQLFYIIASTINFDKKAEIISVFTIDPTQPYTEPTSKEIGGIVNKMATELKWSYVNGNLVGISNDLEQGLLYKDGKCFTCTLDENKEKWVYKIDDQNYDADFDVILGRLVNGHLGSIQEFGAIQSSFIPHIRETALSLGNFVLTKDTIYKTQFDPHHLCITSIQGDCAQIHPFMPPKLVAIWHMLHKKIRTGDSKILIDSYVLNRYITRPYENWKTECDALKPYTSPEVQAFCNTDETKTVKVDTKTDDTSAAETPCTVS